MTRAAPIHVTVSGLATGCIYALNGPQPRDHLPRDATLNFAQGEMLTVSTFLAWSAQRAFGLPHDQFPFPPFFSNRPVALGPVRLAPASLGIIGASLAIMLALVARFRWTRLERAMARLMGISVERVTRRRGCWRPWRARSPACWWPP